MLRLVCCVQRFIIPARGAQVCSEGLAALCPYQSVLAAAGAALASMSAPPASGSASSPLCDGAREGTITLRASGSQRWRRDAAVAVILLTQIPAAAYLSLWCGLGGCGAGGLDIRA